MPAQGIGRIKNSPPHQDGVGVFDGSELVEIPESTYRRDRYTPAIEKLPWFWMDRTGQPVRLPTAGMLVRWEGPWPPKLAATRLIRCQKCGQPSDSIKRFKMPDLVVFLLIFAWGRRATYTACASCMRRIIAERMLINLFTANLCWPFLAIAWIGKIVSSYSKGHSESVVKETAGLR